LTIVAECRYALTGVGPAIAEGSHLRRLGHAAEQDEPEDRGIVGVTSQIDRGQCRQTSGLQGVQTELPACEHHQHQTREQQQATRGGDQQRLQCGSAAVFGLVIEADQHVGADAGQLPEHEHRDDVVRQHHAEHRAHEGEHEAVKAPEPRVAGEIAAAVDQHQRTDPGDQQDESDRQAVGEKGQFDAEIGNPGQGGRVGLAGSDREPTPERHEDPGRNQREEPPRVTPERSRGPRRQGRDQKRQQDAEDDWVGHRAES
jgi:hypothetical protein